MCPSVFTARGRMSGWPVGLVPVLAALVILHAAVGEYIGSIVFVVCQYKEINSDDRIICI